ncbi:hypothetical protein DSM43519_03159 [Mycobacterium marinum]|nr:hypothetical protein CCUG20998_02756 [Mycobacterium marinum]RFZ21957.1 hypothetical protein DSM43519_03159 [Mycobacterium marinum]
MRSGVLRPSTHRIHSAPRSQWGANCGLILGAGFPVLLWRGLAVPPTSSLSGWRATGKLWRLFRI